MNNEYTKSMSVEEQLKNLHPAEELGIKVLYNLPIPTRPLGYKQIAGNGRPSSFHDKKCKRRRKKNKNKKTHR